MPLPQKFVDEGLALAKGAKLFGFDLESLTRDELLAACAQGWKAEQRARDLGMSQLKFMTDVRGARAAICELPESA